MPFAGTMSIRLNIISMLGATDLSKLNDSKILSIVNESFIYTSIQFMGDLRMGTGN